MDLKLHKDNDEDHSNNSPKNMRIINQWADFWCYDIGVNVITANTKEKTTFENWSIWRDKSIPKELHESRKKNGYYDKGIAIITGRLWRGPFEGKYL